MSRPIPGELDKLFRSFVCTAKDGHKYAVCFPRMRPWKLDKADPVRYFICHAYDAAVGGDDLTKLLCNSFEVDKVEYDRVVRLFHDFEGNEQKYVLGSGKMWSFCPNCEITMDDNGHITWLRCKCKGSSKCERYGSYCCSICECYKRRPCDLIETLRKERDHHREPVI